MSTPATNAINALLSNNEFNTLVAALKAKRDEIAGYQATITNFTNAVNQAQTNLTAAQAEEITLQQQIQTAGATIISAVL